LAVLAGPTLLALVLSGCGADDVRLTIDDLRGLVQAGDGLPTLDFEASEITATAAADAESISGYWEESGGAPGECYPIFASSYVLDGSETGDGGDDDSMELGVFTEKGEDDFGLVIVNGRIFDSTDAASGFMSSLGDSVSDCPDGYTLSDGGEVNWEATGFETGTFAGAPDGIRTATVDEVVVTDGAALRTVYLQRGNAVIAFYAETYEGGTFVAGDVAPVITAVAGRFKALG
jgi:hypothetical protein